MITQKQYKVLDDAFEHFNKNLFEGKLPDVLITLHRHHRYEGYHWFEKFEAREGVKNKVSEIALNPDIFSDKSDKDILDVLVHEMCHQWQFYFGTPSRKGYHNWEWASKMIEIGLQPSSTGEPGGKQTGQSMSDYIINGGKFDIVAGAFLLKNKIEWNSIRETVKEKKKRNKTREKFCCPQCHQQAWAKKTAKLACGNCMKEMVIELKEE